MKTYKFKNVKINQIEISLLIGLMTAIFCCFGNIIKDSENLSSKILRLHIIPNSNSNTDQNMKMKLKNAILNKFNFDDYSHNITLAKQKIKTKLNEIEAYSQNFLKNQGYNLPVKASLEKTEFHTRKYENFALPAGTYNALKIQIGKAKGKNWWCIFVPAMCVPAASKTKNKISKILNSNQQNLIQKGSKNEIRFAAIEIFEKIKKTITK